jgi:hypothetical protein
MPNEVIVVTKDFIEVIKTLMPSKLTRINKKSNSELKVFFRGIENHLEISTLHSKAVCPLVEGEWNDYISFQFQFLMSLVKFPPASKQITILYIEKKMKIDTLIFPASLTKTKRF